VRDVAVLLTGEPSPEDVRPARCRTGSGTPDLADRLAATKLGLSVDVVIKRSDALWGKSLTAKRDEVLEQRVRRMYRRDARGVDPRAG
jgi:hypothetical protein